MKIFQYLINSKKNCLKGRPDQNIATALKTQMNFYPADWHDKRMTVVSNIKFNSVTSKIGRSLLCLIPF